MSESRVSLLIRVSPDLKQKLADMAKHERRSLSRQAELLLERCVSEPDSVNSTDSTHKGQRRKP
jgi:hypothetical protein